MVMTSFKHAGEWVTWPPRWFPHEPTLVNYVKVLTPGTTTFELGRQTLKILKPIGDSLIVSGVGSLLAVVLGSVLAYSWARFGTGGPEPSDHHPPPPSAPPRALHPARAGF